MQYILSSMDSAGDIQVIHTEPVMKISPETQETLSEIFTEHMAQACREEICSHHHGKLASVVFSIEDNWHIQSYRQIALSIILGEHENPKIFRQIMERTIQKIKSEPDIFQGFYLRSERSEPKISIMNIHLKSYLQTLSREIDFRILNKRLSLANIIFLGIAAVGKTTIIHRLIHGDFSQPRPTLAPQLLKLVYEQIDFRVYDVGGQKLLRKNWEKIPIAPQAIVFVIDTTHSEEFHEEAAAEFDRMMNFYFSGPEQRKLPLTTPVLLLANKIDLSPEFSENHIMVYYSPEDYGMEYKYFTISAKTGEGLEDAFQWLVKAIKFN